MDTLIHYHFLTVEGLIFVMLLNIFLPLMFRSDAKRYILYTRMGYFAFWALWSMSIFSGLIVFVFTKHALTLRVDAMIALAIILPILDGYRAIKNKRLWLSNIDASNFSMSIVAIELFLTLLLVAVTKM